MGNAQTRALQAGPISLFLPNMAFFGWLRPGKPRPEQRLYENILSAARRPALFGPRRAADTVDGRFEMLALHFAIAYRRLNALDERFAQALFDAFVKDMDANLREMGAGDARFGKSMKHLVASLYGRMQAYEAALEADDAAALADAIARNAQDSVASGWTPALAEEALAADAAIRRLPLQAFLDASLPWPERAQA